MLWAARPNGSVGSHILLRTSLIYLAVTVQRQQSGTTGNLMCRTKLNAILRVEHALYVSDDLMAEAHRTCTSSTLWFQIVAAGRPRRADDMS